MGGSGRADGDAGDTAPEPMPAEPGDAEAVPRPDLDLWYFGLRATLPAPKDDGQ